MIIINLKTYSQNCGDDLYELIGNISALVSKKILDGNKLFISPNVLETAYLYKKYKNINYVMQNTEPLSFGKNTGHIPAELVKNIGIKYTLFNHNESKLSDINIEDGIKMIQSYGINVIVCCENLDQAGLFLKSKPYAIAYEPPELIGSNISVSTQKPEIIKKFVELVGDKSIPIIGAGITSSKDISIGRKLGVRGFIVARAFADSKDKIELLSKFTQMDI